MVWVVSGGPQLGLHDAERRKYLFVFPEIQAQCLDIISRYPAAESRMQKRSNFIVFRGEIPSLFFEENSDNFIVGILFWLEKSRKYLQQHLASVELLRKYNFMQVNFLSLTH